MVSTFRYWSFKDVEFARRRPVQTLLVMILAVMIVATNHEWFLFLGFLGYTVSGPVTRFVVGRTLTGAPAEVSTKELH
jgi:CDP-diacylglycerol--serine O-phosphatidyltransferase